MWNFSDATFGPSPEKLYSYPGHPEIELALLRLYGRMKDVKHSNLARYFIKERGNPKGQDCGTICLTRKCT